MKAIIKHAQTKIEKVETTLEPIRIKIQFERMEIETQDGKYLVIHPYRNSEYTDRLFAIFENGILEFSGDVTLTKLTHVKGTLYKKGDQ